MCGSPRSKSTSSICSYHTNNQQHIINSQQTLAVRRDSTFLASSSTMCRFLPGYWADAPCCERLIFYPMIYYKTLFFPRSPIPGVICEDHSCPVIFFWHVYPPVERFYRYCKSCRPSLMEGWLASDETARRYQQTRPRRFGRLLRQRFPENYPTTLLEDDSEYLSRHPTLGVIFNPSNPPPDWDRAGRYTGFDVDDDASTIVPSTPSTGRQFYNAHPEPADADGDFPDDFSDASTEVEVVWSGFSSRRLEIHTPRFRCLHQRSRSPVRAANQRPWKFPYTQQWLYQD
jgi:hypothetical protein